LLVCFLKNPTKVTESLFLLKNGESHANETVSITALEK